MAYLARTIAEHVCGSLSTNTDPALRELAMRCILDLLGAAFAGSGMPGPSAMRNIAHSQFGDGVVPIWGTGTRAAPIAALLANSAAASALDIDDGHRAARGHPGAAVIPTVLALASQHTATARDIVSAIVLGYDVGVRIAAAQNPERIRTRQSGRWAACAAVAAGARLLKYKPEHVSQALSIAGVLAPNQEANGSSGYSKLTGNDVKEGIAWSAATGLTALSLAAHGHTGPEDFLDHPDYYDGERMVTGLGSRLEILGTYFKPYACCRYVHPALDGFLDVIARHRLKPESITSLDVETFGWAVKLNNTTEPKNLVDVQYSLPYCLAIAAIDGADALVPIKADVLNRPDLSHFAENVRLHVAPEIDALFPGETLARVTVRTNRLEYTSNIQAPLGDPQNPMDWDALEQKFLVITSGVISSERQQLIVDGVLNIANGDVSSLLHALDLPEAGP